MSIVQEIEEFVSGRLPGNVKLLLMNHLVAVHDFLDQLFGLHLVHVPDLLNAHLVRLHEILKLGLQVGELLRQLFVLDSEVSVSLLSFFLLGEELLFDLALHFFELAFLFPLRLDSGFIDFDLLLEHAVVESQLFLVKLVHCLHVLHAFLKYLHFFLQLNFLLGLVIRVQVSDLF